MMPVHTNCSYAACLGGGGPQAVYFIKYIEGEGLETEAYQKLKDGHVLSGTNAPSVYKTKKTRRGRDGEDEERDG